MASKTVEQEVAEWFAARLATIKEADGYSLTLSSTAIYVDGDPEVEEDPAVPFAEFLDNNGTWADPVPGRSGNAVMEYQASIRVTTKAAADDYKAAGRAVFDDVARACWGVAGQWGEDLPGRVVSILPDGWTRQHRDGNYLGVIVNFTVRLSADLRRRPPVVIIVPVAPEG